MEVLSLKSFKKENSISEYKLAKGGFPKSFWETYSAFANTNGGDIYLGVGEKNGEIIIFNMDDETIDRYKKELFSTANNINKVNVNILSDEDVAIINVDGSKILKIHVKRCPIELRPVYINANVYQGTYRRNNEGDYHCSVEEINSMIRDASTKSLDLKILEDHSIESLDKESIRIYRNLFASFHINHPFLREGDNRFLEFIGAARMSNDGTYHPTAAGLLMFGYSYRIVYEYPDFYLDYYKISDTNERWEDRINSDSGDWSGNIFTFFLRVVDKLSTSLNVPFTTKGIFRDDDTLMHKAIREAICNTLCNADYYLSDGICIKQYKNYIEFKNPGTLMMDVEQMLRGGESHPRNKTIMKMFNLINVGERSGSGIPLILAAAKEYKLPLPQIDESYHPDRTTLLLYTKKPSKEEKITALQEKIIECLENNSEMSAKEISDYLSKNVTTIKMSLYDLVDKNIVKSTGTIKNKRYSLK